MLTEITPEMLERAADALQRVHIVTSDKRVHIVTSDNPEVHELGDEFGWLALVKFASTVLTAALQN